jgi:hypothetical protein
MITSIDTSGFHPSVRVLHDYWRQIHPQEGLPGRQHFEPLAVAPLLPHLRLVEVHRDPLRFRYRLLGTQVDAVHGTSLAGYWLDEAFASAPRGRALLAEYARVAETGEPMWRRGAPNVVPEPECAELEVLRLPLAADGRAVDMILCIHLYFDVRGDLLGTLTNRPLGY